MNDEQRPFETGQPTRPVPPGATPVSAAEITTRRAVWLNLTFVFGIVALLLGLHILFPTVAVLILRRNPPAFLVSDPVLATYLLDLVPFYVIAIPLCAFLLSRLPAEKPARRKMEAKAYIAWLCVGLTFVTAGSLMGQIITTIITMITKQSTSSAGDIVGAGNLWLTLLFVGILAPIFEEIIFRKFVINALRRYGEVTAILLSAMIFGLAHGNFTQCFYTFGLGLVLGVLYCRTGNLITSILPHMVLNTCSTLLTYFVLPSVLELTDLSGTLEELFDVLLTNLPALLVASLYAAVFYGGALAGFVLLLIYCRKVRFARSDLLLEAEAGGFYRRVSGRDVRPALVRSPGFWLMIAVAAYMFVLSILP